MTASIENAKDFEEARRRKNFVIQCRVKLQNVKVPEPQQPRLYHTSMAPQKPTSTAPRAPNLYPKKVISFYRYNKGFDCISYKYNL